MGRFVISATASAGAGRAIKVGSAGLSPALGNTTRADSFRKNRETTTESAYIHKTHSYHACAAPQKKVIMITRV